MTAPILETSIKSLKLIHQGKVRDIYAIDDATMLLVSTDRLSAFDVILPTGIANKGAMLTQMANFWFKKLSHIIPNHLTGIDPLSVVKGATDCAQLGVGSLSRAVVVKKLKPLPIEAIVRGYLVGSGWKEYQQKGTVCDIHLPAGLQLAQKLPQPLFTPSSKAAAGAHDENISIAEVEALIGKDMTAQVESAALALYTEAAEYALTRGIIIADTKFEFGLDAEGILHVMDEVLTPDSSRFWPAESYKMGENPPSYDKQYVRDWLESIHWNKAPPAPVLPLEVAERTSEKYLEAFERLTGEKLEPKIFDRLKAVAAQLKEEFEVYRLVLRHPETPLVAKILLGLAVGYLLLPFDLIPDFIPILGQVDDVIIIPLLLKAALVFIPKEIIESCRQEIKRLQ